MDINFNKSGKIYLLNKNIQALRVQIGRLQNYKASLNNAWSGNELVYINNSIDGVIAEMNNVINIYYGLKSDINKLNQEGV